MAQARQAGVQQRQSLFLVGVVVDQALAGGTDVGVLLGQIDEVLFDKLPFGFVV